MIVLSLFSWWYGHGWSGQARRIGLRINGIMDFFSISILSRTLFDPFRQIDAQPHAGPRPQAFFDQLFSRAMGFVVRSFTILFGLATATGVAIIGLFQLMLWPLMPLTPLFGIILAMWGLGR